MAFAIKNVSILKSALENSIQDGVNMIVEHGVITDISSNPIPEHIIEIIDGRGKLLIPGMVNSHTHASMSLFRGLGEGRRDRLTKFFFPLEKKCVSEELVLLAGLYGLQEMLTQGVTAFCDMYYFEDQVGRAAEILGMRGVIGQTVINFPAPDADKPYGAMDRAYTSAQKWANHDLIKFAYAPHAPYTVEPRILQEINKMADETNSLVTMHMAEFEDERERIQQISDMNDTETYIEYMERHGVLREKMILAHMIFVEESDYKILKKHNIGIAHCPIANAKGGKGIAPVWDYFNQGLTVGLATDGPLSGNRLGLRDVVSYAYSMAKLRSGDATHFQPHQIFHLATKGGYDLLQIENGGELKKGSKADFSMINCDDVGMFPDYETVSNLVLSVSDRAFEGTWINGQKVVEHGRVLCKDWDIYQKEIRNLVQNLSNTIREL